MNRTPITRPMLACNETPDFSTIEYPVLATPKLDGIRALMVNGQIVSRSFKPIPNRHIYNTLASILPEGSDGEIMIGTKFQDVSSGVMSRDGQPNFTYNQFDLVLPYDRLDYPYYKRVRRMHHVYGVKWSEENTFDDTFQVVRLGVNLVVPVYITGPQMLTQFEEWCNHEGYEGAMIRSVDGPYKCGRSTAREGWLVKIKRFVDAEAQIVGFYEQEHNENEKTTDAFGNAKRSTHKAGKVAAGVLGGFTVVGINGAFKGVEFDVGSGFDAAQREDLWRNRKSQIGRVVKYKYQSIGSKDKPRIPIFLGFRNKDDM